MRVNTISGSIAGSGAVLFVLIVLLNFVLAEDDPVAFVLFSMILVLAYVAILPLITLIGCIIDNGYRDDFTKRVIHYTNSALVGCLIFTIFLYSAIRLSLSDEGDAILEEAFGIGFFDIFLLIIFTNIASSIVGAIVNTYRQSEGNMNSIEISDFDLAPSTIVELVRKDTPREYFNSLIAGGMSSSEAVVATMSNYPDWNPMHEENP